MERWIELETFPGYLISDNGQLISLKKKHLNKKLRCSVTKQGYKRIRLSLNNNSKKRAVLVHRLVAISFIPNPNNYAVVNHKDGDKSNNNVSNLEWCTSSENQKHAYKTGLKKRIRTISKITNEIASEIRKLSNCGMNDKSISLLFNVSRCNVNKIRNNKLWMPLT